VYDAIIVGGGPAGLSAALVLGRARRRVLVCDAGEPRNAPADAAHGVFTRDGTPPAELLRIGREQLAPYDSVELLPAEVTDAAVRDGGFAITLGDGSTRTARKLVLATSVEDRLPDVEGMAALWARGVYHCPYCHGWEVRDQPLAVYADGEIAMHLAPLLRGWSRDLALLTDGPSELGGEERERLARLGIALREERIARLEADDHGLARVVFEEAEPLPRTALFVRTTQRPRSELAQRLGCTLVEDGMNAGLIEVDDTKQTSVPGVYAAGDVTTPLQQVIVAAASGATVGAMVNSVLAQEAT
jgi:thioredoxin reductase